MSIVSLPLILVPSSDPQEIVSFLLHLWDVSPGGARVLVAPFGAEAEAVAAVAIRMQAPNEGSSIYVTSASSFPATWGAALGVAVDLLDPAAGEVVHVASEEARPEAGWHAAAVAAISSTEIAIEDATCLGFVGRIGMVGPVSDGVRTLAQRLALTEADVVGGASAYAVARGHHFGSLVRVADVLDPLWVALAPGPAWAIVDLGEYTIADLCVRNDRDGYRSVVAEGWYVGRSRPCPRGAEVPGDGAAREAFLLRHTPWTRGPQVVIASTRVTLARLRDLHVFRAVVVRIAALVDGISVVLGNNPLDLEEDPEFAAMMRAASTGTNAQISAHDVALFKACDNASPDAVAEAFGRWIGRVTGGRARSGIGLRVGCSVWTSARDEFAERVGRHEAAIRMGATWVWDLEQDEVFEDRISPALVSRLTSNPNPTVNAYDTTDAVLWDSPRLVREDAPWGDGGSHRGGPHAIRLWRVTGRPDLRGRAAPPTSADGERVASVRGRRFGLLRPVDRALRLPPGGHEEGIRVSAVIDNPRIGLHVLVYEGENADDVGRWMDEAHGVVDAVVLVWTGSWDREDKPVDLVDGEAYLGVVFDGPDPRTGPGRNLWNLAALYGARWIHRPLADDLAGARNAGIDALRGLGLGWAWFVDPDEWWFDPRADARAMRRMAESSRLGWLVQTANYRANGEPTVSDSIRMTRLDGAPLLRMNGRVHEGFGDVLNQITSAGGAPRLTYAPFVVQHRGMALDPARLAAKLDKYERLLRLELADNPENPGAWVSLAWHFDNDGHTDLAEECLRRGLACAGTSYLPHREVAYLHLRKAREAMTGCLDRLVSSHQFYREAVTVFEWLRVHAPPAPKIETGGREDRTPDPLPAFPRYDGGGGSA